MSERGTRQTMIDTAVTLFQRNGYRATSWRGLVEAGKTPWGSVQHHFPGGKEQLGVEAVGRAGEIVDSFLDLTLQSAPTAADAVREWFTTSAQLLERSGFRDGCPVAPVALEMAPDSPALTAACNDALTRWISTLRRALEASGIEATEAADLASAIVAGFEGSLVLARTRRETGGIARMGELMAGLVETAIP